MKRCVAFLEIGLFLLTVILVNGTALQEALFYGHRDASFFESTTSEDELRYLAKIREASEGNWLMSNPYLKEHSQDSLSPSGFMEWIPAAFLRLFHGDFGWMLLFTDLLCTSLSIFLLRLWLGKLLRSPFLTWATILFLFFSPFGGELIGILRDTTPKFSWPILGLYLYLLTFKNRISLKQTALRGLLIGAMYYSYPYHWTVALLAEAWLVLYSAYQQKSVRPFFVQGSAALVPFIILAAPLALIMRSALSRPEFAGFYDRYHIIHTHIPAAPFLQIVLVIALVIAFFTMRWLSRHRHISSSIVINDFLPLILPILGMLLLLNANVITGKDPELGGHGGRVIMPIVTALYALILSRVLMGRVLRYASIIACIVMIAISASTSFRNGQTMHQASMAWETSPEKEVLTWLNDHLEPEQIIAAPRILSERIPVYTSHYVFFGAGAHFFLVSAEELTDRYLGWVGLYPAEKEPTTMGTLVVFGNYPGAQWSKERVWYELFHDDSFTLTQADFMPDQELRKQIDREHAAPDALLTAERIKKYHTDVIVLQAGQSLPEGLRADFTKATTIGPYEMWRANRTDVTTGD